MNSLSEKLAEDRRRVILSALFDDAGYRLADEALTVTLRHLGRGTQRVDVIRADLAWLEEQRLVRVEKHPQDDGSEMWIGLLTRDGRRVAEGAPHPGVARADPR